jgi:ribulose-5-phosphate 4-epimerase/fuculose-1-phosphate aldolase
LTTDQKQAAELVAVARSLFDRGYSFGTAGNLSVRAGDTILVTPTGSSLGSLAADALARIDSAGNIIGEIRPSKEAHFHLAIYRARPQCAAVVHLHSTYATAVSCLRNLDTEDALPALTPYYAMRVLKPCAGGRGGTARRKHNRFAVAQPRFHYGRYHAG